MRPSKRRQTHRRQVIDHPCRGDTAVLVITAISASGADPQRMASISPSKAPVTLPAVPNALSICWRRPSTNVVSVRGGVDAGHAARRWFDVGKASATARQWTWCCP